MQLSVQQYTASAMYASMQLQLNVVHCIGDHSEPVMAVLELFSAASPPDCSPVEDVEEEEEHREDD